MIPVACKVPVLPVGAKAVEAARVAAGVVRKDAGNLLLRFPDGNDVVCRTRFLAGLEFDMELGIVGGVEAQEFVVEVFDILDFAIFQMNALADVVWPRRSQAGNFYRARLALYKVDVDNACVDGLR